MEFLIDYGLFLAKTLTFVVAIAIIIGLVVSAGGRGSREEKGKLEVKKLNDHLEDTHDQLLAITLPEEAYKKHHKDEKKRLKKEAKENKDTVKPKVFVIDFQGDIRASALENMRREITGILSLATKDDEVVVKLESGGGMVHSYGLAASQLDRIKKKEIPLTVCVDKVAASGGYMMACVADRILAAPFAILGSIGVVAQLPNFHRLLKKNDIDFELLTAGEHKRTLTMFGENTDKGREKFVEDLQMTHDLFKDYVSERRGSVSIDDVANGDVWFGTKALEEKLIDEVKTSDEYLVELAADKEVYEVAYVAKKSLPEKMGLAAETSVSSIIERLYDRLSSSRFFS